ncbi:Outer membrane efflux protein [Methylobacterium sp. 174MFSha1.1]|uniref:TolC family protein n=1 Tax=Methylobacterium sp. 174MFSha1.1 TaxID=1502749 RepID=UPI0008EFE1B0|nr:TolC family protein [Methylobacterium sp. 174MFSha1.1]SFU88570.1 Outer membrane efflux protein [Methylobacterium sp. 174MFSha1.1]
MSVRRARMERLGCVLAILAGSAAAVRAQSLEEASAAALESSFVLRAERARQDGAEERLRGAIDAFMPTVAFTADRPLRSKITYAPEAAPPVVGLDATPRRAPSVVGITANLSLFDGFRRWNGYQTARTLAESGRLLLIGRRQQVLLDTAIAYIAVLRDTRILAAREAQRVAIQRIAAFTDKQFELNDATRTDVALARSRVQEAEALRLRAQADLTASRLEFTRLTRMAPERMLPPRLPDGLPRSADAYADLVRKANPDIAAFQLEAEAAGYQAKAAVADLLPKVNLQFSKIAQLGYSPALDRITDTTTRVVATVPIYEPGSLPRIGEASALARQRGYEAQDKELATLTAARIAFARRQATAEQYVQLTARIRELRETMRGFGIERAAGFRTVLDELNIRGELANAEVAAEVVLNERDGQALQLAAAAALLDAAPGGPPARRFESVAPPSPALRRSLAAAPPDGVPVPRASAAMGTRALPAPVLRVSRAEADSR